MDKSSTKNMKKGQANLIFVGLILGLIILTLILITQSEAEEVLDKDTKGYDCVTSIELSSLLSKLSGGDIPLRCKTKEIFYEENIEKNSEAIKHELAEEMKDCWQKFGRGEKELFSNEGTYCNICTHIAFDDKNQGKTIGEFTEYLSTNKPRKSSLTYMDYLANVETPQFQSLINDKKLYNKKDNNIEKEISGDKEYAILFAYARGERAIDEFRKGLSGGTENTLIGSGVLGSVAGTTVAVILIATTPVGWVAAGVAGFVTFVSVVTHGIIDFTSTAKPEYLAMTLFIDFTPEQLASVGCNLIK
jgi:hypothetical protein